MWSFAGSLAAHWAVGASLLGWPRFSPAWRRSLALAWSLAGLACLVIALNTEGSRASPSVAVFLLGTHYVTATAQASASLPFYLLSGVALLLGFAGLAAGDEVVAWLRRHYVASAILLSFGVTALRFVLEKTAAPPALAQMVGVTWLVPVVGAFFFLCARAEGAGISSVLRALVVYALAVRGGIVLLMLLATARRMGSHYDVSSLTLVRNPLTGRTYEFVSGSLAQFLGLAALPQLVAWPLYTLVVGLVGVALAAFVLASWRNSATSATGGAPAVGGPRPGETLNARGRS
jgi:hypothetical protein